MAWQDEMTQLLRVMVWDFSDAVTTELYTDASLQDVLVASAQLVLTSTPPFSKPFVASITNIDITPDPTDDAGGTRDFNFENLVCMRAAAIVDQGVVRTQSGIIIRDNGSLVDLSKKLAAALRLLEVGWAKTYEQERLRYAAGLLQADPPGCAVMGAFRDMCRDYYGCDGVMDIEYYPRGGNYSHYYNV